MPFAHSPLLACEFESAFSADLGAFPAPSTVCGSAADLWLVALGLVSRAEEGGIPPGTTPQIDHRQTYCPTNHRATQHTTLVLGDQHHIKACCADDDEAYASIPGLGGFIFSAAAAVMQSTNGEEHQHRSTNSASSTASATSSTSNTAAAYLLQHLGSVPTSNSNPGLNIYAPSPQQQIGVPTSVPQQQQQQQYRAVVPQPQESQIVQYSPGMTMANPMPMAPKPGLALSPNNIQRLTFSDRERQIKRRTKTGSHPYHGSNTYL
jgi:hypothetical protein